MMYQGSNSVPINLCLSHHLWGKIQIFLKYLFSFHGHTVNFVTFEQEKNNDKSNKTKKYFQKCCVRLVNDYADKCRKSRNTVPLNQSDLCKNAIGIYKKKHWNTLQNST